MTLAATGEREEEILDTSLVSSTDQVTKWNLSMPLLRTHTMQLAFGYLMVKSQPKAMSLSLPSIVVRGSTTCT
jgi:hypothetical protein